MRKIHIYIACILLAGSLACKENAGTGENPDPSPVVSTPLPLISITTNGVTIVDEPKIEAEMRVSLVGVSLLESMIGIEYRGSTSQRIFEKFSYSLETWDENGNDRDVSIFTIPEEEDWILYGPYSDKTLLRNVLIYDLSRKIGRYASRTAFTELSLNEDYKGVYVFMEKLKRDNNRIDLSDLDPDEIEGDDLTGGYILKIDKTAGDTDDPNWSGDEQYTADLGFRSDFDTDGNRLSYEPYGPKRGEETYYLYEDPAPEDIMPEQSAYIQNYIQAFEESIQLEDFSSSNRAYEDFIDVDSFVDFFLLNELSANPDAYRLSTYLYKDRGGKLHMGPIWDFNIAFGNDGRSATNQWIYLYNDSYPGDLWLVPFWWEKLLFDPKFKKAVKARWNALKSDQFSEATIHSMIDEYVNILNEASAVDSNFERWEIIGEELPFNSFVGESYEAEIEYVKNWISDRISWLDTEIQGFD